MMCSTVLWSLLALSLLAALARAQGSQQNFFPPRIPLAIRHPYMSVWQRASDTTDRQLPSNSSGPLSQSWPYFWGQPFNMGWAGQIRVDGQAYAWMGRHDAMGAPASVTNIQITPTRTIYEMQAGPMSLTITFLSPIEPSDWVRQSMPFAYVSLEASSLDGNTHTVQVYSDISAGEKGRVSFRVEPFYNGDIPLPRVEWVSGNRTSSVSWTSQTTSSSRYHEIVLQDADVQDFVEHNNQAQDGKGYYAVPLSADLTWQIDGDTTTRTLFRTQGSLSNDGSTAFATISPIYTVFAFAVNLGQIQSTTTPVTWAVGILRDPTVLYTTPSGGTEERRPIYTSQYSSVADVIDAVTTDFGGALERAIALDDKILSSANAISPQYADAVSLATRQTMGSLDFTISGSVSGSPDASDIKIFMKDIGSSGRVNPVERMFAALPMYMYLNASIARGLLRPLLEWQDGLTDQQFASQDLGLTYPQATGTRGDSTQGLEQTGNMLIMLYAHARFSGDGSLLMQHYNTTKRWANYLVSNSLILGDQHSADNENIANLTNLALKGIIGVKAMAEISRVVGEDLDAEQFDNSASTLIQSWQSMAVAADNRHILGTYGDQQSSALMYNIYADLLLGTRLIPQSILDLQTQFYSTQLPTAPPFGLPIDSNSGTGGSAAWTLLTSATVSDVGVRNSLIQGIWDRMSYNETPAEFFDTYDVSTGVAHGGNAGPALGATYSHLALTIPNRTIIVTGSNGTAGGGENSDGKSSPTTEIAPIVGGVVGGITAVVIAVCVYLHLRRKKRNRGQFEDEIHINPFNDPSPYSYRDTPSSPTLTSSDPVVAPGWTRLHRGGSGLKVMSTVATRSSLSMYLSDAATVGQPSKASDAGPHMAPEQHNHVPEAVLSESGPAVHSGSSEGRGTMPLTDVIGLRDEVENLRRVMREIRGDRFEPPPEYEA